MRAVLLPVWRHYGPLRAWVLAHPALAVAIGATLGIVALLVGRALLVFWSNEVKTRLSGTHFVPERNDFPMRKVDLDAALARTPKDCTFVGMTARRGALGWKWKPLHLSETQRSMHVHVLGKTGSGKTTSVLWPQVLQDVLAGKGVVVIDAKGSDENVRTMKAIAVRAGREADLRVFSLPAWNQPQLFSHRYNLVWVRPRTATDAGGDVAAMAERVFRVMPLGDNAYFNVQAELAFTNVCRMLHGMLDDRGCGKPFNVIDIATVLKGVGVADPEDPDPKDPYAKALKRCLDESADQVARRAIENQVSRLGHDVQQCFTGIIGALDRFTSPLVNAYAPDIVFEDVLERGFILYIQLPSNLFKVQAPAIGKAMLMDLQQEGSLRQVFRSRSQRPVSVVVDEFANFADLSIIDSLNKLRDARLQFTLAHQSIADLELVSKEFAAAVWDNTRTKIILSQDNPELCEKVSKSIGTTQVVEQTVRREEGPLLTSLATGDASTKLVEAFRLHPNAIKALAAAGQGYCYFGTDIERLALGQLREARPGHDAELELERNDQEKADGLRLFENFIKGR